MPRRQVKGRRENDVEKHFLPRHRSLASGGLVRSRIDPVENAVIGCKGWVEYRRREQESAARERAPIKLGVGGRIHAGADVRRPGRVGWVRALMHKLLERFGLEVVDRALHAGLKNRIRQKRQLCSW